MKVLAFMFVAGGTTLNIVNAVTVETPGEAYAWAAAAAWSAFALLVMAVLAVVEHSDGD